MTIVENITGFFASLSVPACRQAGAQNDLASRARAVAVVATVVFVFVSVGGVFAYPYVEPQLDTAQKFVTEQVEKAPRIVSAYGKGIEKGVTELGPTIVGLVSEGKESAAGFFASLRMTIGENYAEFFASLRMTTGSIGERIGNGIVAVRETLLLVPRKIVKLFKKERAVPYEEYVKFQRDLEGVSEQLRETRAKLEEQRVAVGEKEKEEEKPPPRRGGKEEVEEEAAGFFASLRMTKLERRLEEIQNGLTAAEAAWNKDLTSAKARWKTAQQNIAAIQKWESDIETIRSLSSKVQVHPPSISHSTAPAYVGSQGLNVGGTASFSDLSVTKKAGLNQLGVGSDATFGTYASDSFTVKAASTFHAPIRFREEVTVGTSTANLTITKEGNLTSAGDLVLSGDLTVGGSQTNSGPLSLTVSSSVPALEVNQTGAGRLADFQNHGTSQLYLTNSGSLVVQGTTTAATYVSADDDSTVRKLGEEVMRATAPLFRYDIPSQTSTTTFFRISKAMAANPLSAKPSVLPGATRVYRLAIKYTDDMPTASTSEWRIYKPSTATTTDTFTLSGRNASDLQEGTPYLTEVLDIPNSNDWQVQVKVPNSSGTIRIFQIFLAAYDRVE